jgi:hypothetical protein
MTPSPSLSLARRIRCVLAIAATQHKALHVTYYVSVAVVVALYSDGDGVALSLSLSLYLSLSLSHTHTHTLNLARRMKWW